MKYLFLFLVSTSAFALDYWEPSEKELSSLEWRAAHTPQEKLARKFSKLENMDFVREFNDCESTGFRKPSSSQLQNLQKLFPCRSYHEESKQGGEG